MKILVPINIPKDIGIMSREGSGAFYCGNLPEMWRNEYQESVFK